MFEKLKQNIKQEKKIIGQVRELIEKSKDSQNKQIYIESIRNLLKQLYILNRSVPELLKEWSPIINNPIIEKKVIQGNQKVNLRSEAPQTFSYVSPSDKQKNIVTIKKEDKKEFLKKLKISEENLLALEKIKKKRIEEKKQQQEIKKPNYYAKISNKLFRKLSEKLAPGLTDLANDLKKANMQILLTTYISMAILSSLIGFSLGLIGYFVSLVINISNLIYFWVPFLISLVIIAIFYMYPSIEASSIKDKIDYELPFATIHMAAISSSNIEPTRLFKIIAESKEYPALGSEMSKIVAQVEVYGYNLINALKNVSERTPSKKLSELLSGIATNMTTGGELKDFLEQKAANYLLDYKLERQKFTDLAGTFMDIYISILIAAPLVLIVMLVVMEVADMGFGLSFNFMFLLSIIAIVFANIIFLFIVNLKQPKT